MAQMRIYYTTSDKLGDLPIVDGQFIYVPTDNTFCIDMGGQRFYYQTIKTFETDENRQETPYLNNGFYFVKETKVLWQWSDNNWIQITPNNVLATTFYGEKTDDFPNIGNQDSLYFTDDGIYNWKTQLNEYNLIANASTWDSI